MNTELSQLIDERNEKMWKSLQQRFNISIEMVPGQEHSVYSKGEDVTFYVPKNSPDAGSFTHELLHVYLRSKKMYIGANLLLTISSSKIMKRIFSDALLEHMGNILDHIKMFPLYERMGYDPSSFLLDFYTNKCEMNEVNLIRKNFKQGATYNALAVGAFIGRFFAVKGDVNKSFDYSVCLSNLKKIDSKLFEALDLFFDEWENFDIESNDPLYTYREVVHAFYEYMKVWIIGKRFE